MTAANPPPRVPYRQWVLTVPKRPPVLSYALKKSQAANRSVEGPAADEALLQEAKHRSRKRPSRNA